MSIKILKVKNIGKLEEQVDRWNRECPVGTAVRRYKLIRPLREGKETVTRSVAWVSGGHSAMVMVEGVSGGVLLESLKVIPPKYIPLDKRFPDKVKDGIKISTIRKKQWEVGKQYAFFTWSGVPYRSLWWVEKILVECVSSDVVGIFKERGEMKYAAMLSPIDKDDLALQEGFETVEEMDVWFEKSTKGKPTTMFLNHFEFIKTI